MWPIATFDLPFCFKMFMDYFIKVNNNFSFLHSYILWWVNSVVNCLQWRYWDKSGTENQKSYFKTQFQKIKFCHWNLNGLTAHDITKVSLLQALPLTRDYDVFCLSKTFLIRLFQMKTKELILKVTIRNLRVDNPSKKMFYIIRNTVLLLKEIIYVP